MTTKKDFLAHLDNNLNAYTMTIMRELIEQFSEDSFQSLVGTALREYGKAEEDKAILRVQDEWNRQRLQAQAWFDKLAERVNEEKGPE